MSKNLNISVLVSARDEYIQQLKCILIPLIVQGLNSIYQDAITITGNKKVIYKFQELLKEIPKWNQTILQEESKRIKKKCAYIMDIVTAIFVTNVKILASVRLKGSKDDIRVKIPTSDIFIHGIYIETAQHIFYDPFLFYHRKVSPSENQKNKHIIREIISVSIDETIRRMLPFDDILQKYLADALQGNADIDTDSESSGCEEVSDSDEESINNDDLDLSDSEPDEPEFDPDQDKTKQFTIDKNETTFIPESVSPLIPQPPPPSQEYVFEPPPMNRSFELPPPLPERPVESESQQFYEPDRHRSVSESSDSESEISNHGHQHHHHHHQQQIEPPREHHQSVNSNNKYSFFD
jgi:hypothetical protein